MPHHHFNQPNPLASNSLNYIVGSIDQITQNSVSDLTVLGEKDIEH